MIISSLGCCDEFLPVPRFFPVNPAFLCQIKRQDFTGDVNRMQDFIGSFGDMVDVPNLTLSLSCKTFMIKNYSIEIVIVKSNEK